MSKRKITRNQHHILYPRNAWGVGYAQLLRRAFVCEVDWETHDALHAKMDRVPVPNEAALREAWLRYEEERHTIDDLTLCEKIAWLQHRIDDIDFCESMQVQLDHFLGK